MHEWGDAGVDWDGITDCAIFIGTFLRRWGRMCVRDMKEKYGTVRVYCSFGWNTLHSITHPGYAFYQYPKWLWKLDLCVFYHIIPMLNVIIIPYHKWLYRLAYKKALVKWPHLREEILCCADWDEVLEGL